MRDPVRPSPARRSSAAAEQSRKSVPSPHINTSATVGAACDISSGMMMKIGIKRIRPESTSGSGFQSPKRPPRKFPTVMLAPNHTSIQVTAGGERCVTFSSMGAMYVNTQNSATDEIVLRLSTSSTCGRITARNSFLSWTTPEICFPGPRGRARPRRRDQPESVQETLPANRTPAPMRFQRARPARWHCGMYGKILGDSRS